MNLAEKLMFCGGVEFSYDRYDHGTKENPDIPYDRVWAEIERCYDFGGNMHLDIAIYLSKEDDEFIWETHEMYRMPFVEDLDLLEKMLVEAKGQSHLTHHTGNY